MIILNGTKAEHLDMLDGGIIQRLLEEKWKTFARLQFLKRLAILFVHLFVLSAAVYSRPDRTRSLMPPVDELEPLDYSRFCFEIITCLSCFGFLIVQQNAEIKNLGLAGFLRQLVTKLYLNLMSIILSCYCVECSTDTQSSQGDIPDIQFPDVIVHTIPIDGR